MLLYFDVDVEDSKDEYFAAVVVVVIIVVGYWRNEFN